MAEKRTFASVTDLPCTCEHLQNSADNPDLPIIFDPESGEYQFKFTGPDGKGQGYMVIYHCPFCGGTTPRSKRALLFATISLAEEMRLATLLAPLTTTRKALRPLGKPQRDGLLSGSRQRETDGKPPRSSKNRTLVYEHLSETADVRITEHTGGSASWHLQGKYLGKPQ